MPTVLLATDADRIVDQVEAALVDDETSLARVSRGADVLAAVDEVGPSLIVLDLQIANMGGMAACMAVRHEQIAGRMGDIPVLMLLDRPADTFLAERSQADGWLVKPLHALRLRRAADALLGGYSYVEAGPSA